MSVMDMQDRELLELAAKAMGCKYVENIPGHFHLGYPPNWNGHKWNPLESRSDAMEMASKLGLIVDFFHERAMSSLHHASGSREWQYPEDGGEKYPAICRAITRAAAEIGRRMPC